MNDEEDFRRPNDHLVEPFFVGLEAKDERASDEVERKRNARRPGWFGWLAAILRRFTLRSRDQP